MTKEESSICDIFRKHLVEKFPLYSEQHSLFAKVNDNKIYIVYDEDQLLVDHRTRAYIQIQGNLAHINSVEVKEKSKGFGTKLYSAIEEFLKDMGCSLVRLTASGMGLNFWPKMGFKALDLSDKIDVYAKELI